MAKCPNCELPLTSAPWRFDDAEHGIHWVCPALDAPDPEVIYAPVRLSEAIDGYLRERSRTTISRIG
jgi:hypothetical protein